MAETPPILKKVDPEESREPVATEPPFPEAVWNPIRGPFTRWPNLTDFCIALLSFFLNLVMWSHDGPRDVLAMATLADVGMYLCAFCGNFALLWRRSQPWRVHLIIVGLSFLLVLVGSVDGIVAMVFSLYSLGRFEANNRNSLIGVSAAFVLVVIDLGVTSMPSAGSTIAAMMVLMLWYVGRRLRFRGEYLRLLEERARYLERERHSEAERAVTAERTRIAREMHDVVAHQVSLMTIQAGAARTVGASDPDAASEAMASVETAGRQALAEMRQLLGLMRPANAKASLAPQPDIKGLPKLVEQVKDAGIDVQLNVRGDLDNLPAGLELTVYRIVQEALTNVIKHAGEQVQACIKVEGSAENILVCVKDNGIGVKGEKAGGHGILGMRERVQLQGGSLRAGPGAEGGFEVFVKIPRNPLHQNNQGA